MLKAILDTDILSEIIKGVDRNVSENASLYLDEHSALTFTSVSVYEVLYGLEVKKASKQKQEFLALIGEHEEIVPETGDYRMAAEIRAALRAAGTPIGNADPVIAACCVRRSLPLVTGNIRHHEFIRDAGFSLQLSNWRDLAG